MGRRTAMAGYSAIALHETANCLPGFLAVEYNPALTTAAPMQIHEITAGKNLLAFWISTYAAGAGHR